MLRITILAVVAIAAAVQAVPVQDGGWNVLLKAEGLFHDEINAIRSKSSDKLVILSELKDVLGQDAVLPTMYSKYVAKFNKVARDPPTSMQVFQDNLLKIAAHNLDAQQGIHTWVQGVTQFTDLTAAQFMSQFPTIGNLTIGSEDPIASFPPAQSDAKDWRAGGKIVTPIKDQQQCGSCTSFACSATIESAKAIKSKTTAVSASAQEILDCATAANDDVCNNGMDPRNAFNYAKSTGVATWDSYPYTGKRNTCKPPKSKSVKLSSWTFIGQDEDSLKSAVAQRPAAIVVQVSQDFQNYRGGVFSEECQNSLNHAVTMVGYTQTDGANTWIIKNSWNTWWGDKGYMYVTRDGTNNVCITNYAITPTV